MRLLIYFPILEDGLLQHILDAAEGFDVEIAGTPEEAQDLLPGAEILFGMFPPELFACRDESLKWIQSFSAGMDNFLYPEAVESDVIVTGASGCYGAAAADSAFGLLLAFTRGLVTRLRADSKSKTGLLELEGLTLGVLGLGGMGREMAKRGKGFGMRVIAIDPVARDDCEHVDLLVEPEEIDSVIPELDALMSACALTPQSRHIINEPRLRAMKPSAYIVNVSRGPIIDEQALTKALKEDWIAGAGLDVTEIEPVSEDSELRQMDNVILTFHSAGGSQNRQKKFIELFCRNLKRYRDGESLLNIVNKKRGF
ncbi:MAG: D-2-hydroxyacid dehydrogenase [Planctomycetota bacterium]|nr:D-2-hydroxyacid dehydrogenase [Planctomycetota bacterium]